MTLVLTSQMFAKIIAHCRRTAAAPANIYGRCGAALAFAIAVCLFALPVRADDLLDQSAQLSDSTMPQRERDFIAIFAEMQKGPGASRSVTDTRLRLQTRVINFLAPNPDATNWIGILRDAGKTDDGERWIDVEIAPGVMIATCHDRACDPNNLTLIRPHTPVFKSLQEIGMRERVIFNAHIFGGLIAADAAMVDAPRMISRFDAIKIPQQQQ